MIQAYAAKTPKGPLERLDYEPGPLSQREVEIDVQSCGICHSDLSIINNDWGISRYPVVPGHEVIGTVVAVGPGVSHLRPGQTVGVGWFSGSCCHCRTCMGGDHNLCGEAEQTIVGRHGGFADTLRAQAEWVFPLPQQLEATKAGPLFCGGITVFNPLVQNNIRPTDRIGVVGIGGLGHLALQFGRAWGCEVTAFSSSPDKEDEARRLGAHHFVASTRPEAVRAVADSLDLLLVTINVPLDWQPFLAALRAKGKLHFVGAVPSVQAGVFDLLPAQKSIGASPLGSPATIATMLEFCARHGIEPQTEHFKLSEVNHALDRLREGKPRYRIVLENDF